MKKKKGNTLLLLLVIGMIITILGTTLAGAISYTTKSNLRDKDIEDLIFAAESGIDYAYAKLKTDGTSGITMKYTDGGVHGVALTSLLFNKVNELTVEVTPEDADGTIKIIGSSKNTDSKTRKVTATFKKAKALTGDVFNNSLVASKDKVGVNGNGTINLGTTNINSPADHEIGIGGVGPDEVKKAAYEDLDFITQFKHVKQVNVKKIGGLEGAEFRDEKGRLIPIVNLTEYATDPTHSKPLPANINGVGYIKYGFGYSMYIVNTDELNIIYDGAPEQRVKNLVICKGKVNFRPEVVGGQFNLHLVHSMIFGTSVYVDQKGSITMSYMPRVKAGETLWGGELTDAQYTEVNEDLKLFIKNWITAAGGGPGGPGSITIIKDDYTITE